MKKHTMKSSGSVPMTAVVRLQALTVLGCLVLICPGCSRKESPKPPDKWAERPLAEVKVAAEQGDAKAQYRLGLKYGAGQEMSRDLTEATKWFHKAADQGDSDAQFILGMGCMCGDLCPEDHPAALAWFRKAADQGHVAAKGRIGDCYARGIGVQKDDAEAVKWFRKAARDGDPHGEYEIGRRYFDRSFPGHKALAVRWFRKAANHDDPDAQCTLGKLLMAGVDVSQDYEEAVTWFRKAASQKHADGLCGLGICYLQGKGVPKSNTEAYQYFVLAEVQGSKAAGQLRNGLSHTMSREEVLSAQQPFKDALNKTTPGGEDRKTLPNNTMDGDKK